MPIRTSSVVPDITTLQRRVLAATSVSYIVVILDTSIVNVALGRIALWTAAALSCLSAVVWWYATHEREASSGPLTSRMDP